MRPMWSGMISFGLVNIPVKLYTAVKSHPYEMNYLRRDDLCPIQYKRVCRRTGEEVPFEQIVRGYQFRKGDYIVLEEEDFKKAGVKKTYTIDVEVFVDEKEIDGKFLEKPYFLEPDKKAQKTYALFRQALTKSKKVGIGRFVLKDREHLVMLKPQDKVIILNQMRFAELLKDPGELDLPGEVNIPKNQMELAMELINKFAGTFKPREFHDTYTQTIREIVEAKKKGKPIRLEEEKIPVTQAEDILVKLKASLETANK
ncbi:MAG: Ku protein [Candidatus Omnitrophica bacterium]|nr:Ku protein [Candidatus Omnitrophota bacterium]MDD5552508.1 Ku protein [Candidatus Omnitrophota bacterium]